MPPYDKKINKLFYYWLLFTFSLVFLMVLVGGLTRLTNSGLSITEWELFKGIIPPINIQQWENYFSLYKNIPQYKLINIDMTMQEFKFIFYWEYFHRVLGRIIGLSFLLPFLFFYFYSKVSKKYLAICTTILFLIFLQGLVGWFMVQSGLVNNITVSHYRLSLHLGLAFIIISMIFWTLLNIKNNTFKTFFKFDEKNYFLLFFVFLIFIQIIFGALVSGLDAGQLYQTWPLMDRTYFPGDTNINELANFFDFNNHGLVQFYHRNIAYVVLLYSCFIGYIILKKNLITLKKPFYLVTFILFIQITLGIFTLISGINIFLASAHQIFSLLLVLSVINLYYNYIN
jgi:cytochrome c oxidase assembly protein subunit 15